MTDDATPEELAAIRAALNKWTPEQWQRFRGPRLTILPLTEWVGLLQEVGWLPTDTAARAAFLLYGEKETND